MYFCSDSNLYTPSTSSTPTLWGKYCPGSADWDRLDDSDLSIPCRESENRLVTQVVKAFEHNEGKSKMEGRKVGRRAVFPR